MYKTVVIGYTPVADSMAEKIEEKSNEIKAIPELIKTLDLKNCIIPLMLSAARNQSLN